MITFFFFVKERDSTFSRYVLCFSCLFEATHFINSLRAPNNKNEKEKQREPRSRKGGISSFTQKKKEKKKCVRERCLTPGDIP